MIVATSKCVAGECVPISSGRQMAKIPQTAQPLQLLAGASTMIATGMSQGPITVKQVPMDIHIPALSRIHRSKCGRGRLTGKGVVPNLDAALERIRLTAPSTFVQGRRFERMFSITGVGRDCQHCHNLMLSDAMVKHHWLKAYGGIPTTTSRTPRARHFKRKRGSSRMLRQNCCGCYASADKTTRHRITPPEPMAGIKGASCPQ